MVKNQETAWLLQEKYAGIESAAFFADCARLSAGEPLAYLIGHAPFLDCTIHIDSHPLIPRVETEFWVEKAITTISQKVRGLTPHLRILDLCAGSGAIGVAVAKAVPGAGVTFTEIDPAHLPSIQKNLSENIFEYPNRLGYYSVVESDLFSALQTAEQYDYILTNPPYIDATANTVDAGVAAYEPHLALFGGVAGMEIITRIITESPTHLAPTGQLWIEHEPSQVVAITTLAQMHRFTCVTHPDQYNTPRFSVLSMAQ